MSNTIDKYNNTQIALHMISAFLIIFLLLMGHFVLSEMPNADPTKVIGLRGHMVFGILVLALTVFQKPNRVWGTDLLIWLNL